MIIQKVYDRYDIMPTLQEHMYRVAGVAQQIVDASDFCNDADHIISACLLHDMGNILKFDLDKIPDGVVIDDVGHRKDIQQTYREKWGDDEHSATVEIAREIGVSERTMKILLAVGTSQTERLVVGDDLAGNIANYADQRVAPHGVVSLQERIINLQHRYAHHAIKRERYAKLLDHGLKIEATVFYGLSISPSDIGDRSIVGYLDELSEYQIV